MQKNKQTLTTWHPVHGFLLLRPIVLPNRTESKIILPDEVVTKTQSGIVVEVGGDNPDNYFLGKEVFFAKNNEYVVQDSDTGKNFILLPENKVLMWREPAPMPEFFPVSEGEGERVVPQIRLERLEPIPD